MDPVNLLAFIQIAVAFDFGLIYLSNTHILSNVLDTFLAELRSSYSSVENRLQSLYKATDHHKLLGVRVTRAEIAELMRALEFHLNRENIRWEKYAYTGICSGAYGLLCLLLIGLTGCKWEGFIHNFLLISGELIVIYQCINLIQLSSIVAKNVSIVKIIYKLLWLCLILALSYVAVLYGFFWSFWHSFNGPFVALVIIIVYFPISVYIFRIIQINYQIKRLIKKCKDKLTHLQCLISSENQESSN